MTRFSSALAATTALTLIALLGPNRPAAAFKKFADKEKKPCSYCHVNPRGGGKRTEAGMWYGSHGNSFAGFKAKAAAKPAAKPGKKR